MSVRPYRPFSLRMIVAAGSMMLAAGAGVTMGGPVFAPVGDHLVTLPTMVRTSTQTPVAVVTTTRRRRSSRQWRQAWGSNPHDVLRQALEARIGRMSGRQWNRVRRYLQRAATLAPVAMKIKSWLPEHRQQLAHALIAKRCQPTVQVSARGRFLLGTVVEGPMLLPDVGPNRVHLITWAELAKVFA